MWLTAIYRLSLRLLLELGNLFGREDRIDAVYSLEQRLAGQLDALGADLRNSGDQRLFLIQFRRRRGGEGFEQPAHALPIRFISDQPPFAWHFPKLLDLLVGQRELLGEVPVVRQPPPRC